MGPRLLDNDLDPQRPTLRHRHCEELWPRGDTRRRSPGSPPQARGDDEQSVDRHSRVVLEGSLHANGAPWRTLKSSLRCLSEEPWPRGDRRRRSGSGASQFGPRCAAASVSTCRARHGVPERSWGVHGAPSGGSQCHGARRVEIIKEAGGLWPPASLSSIPLPRPHSIAVLPGLYGGGVGGLPSERGWGSRRWLRSKEPARLSMGSLDAHHQAFEVCTFGEAQPNGMVFGLAQPANDHCLALSIFRRTEDHLLEEIGRNQARA